MFKKKLLLLVALEMLGIAAFTQVKPLNIGDMVPPEMELAEIINGKVNKYKFSDFKDKLLILDFWATWCGSCIGAMPKMEALQKQFGDKIVVLPVTAEKKDIVFKFWEKHPEMKMSLPTITGNTDFHKMFVHNSIPFEAWIYKGKVIGMTDDEHVNETEITNVLSGKDVSWPIYSYVSYDLTQPLLKERNDVIWANKKGAYYTTILPYIPRTRPYSNTQVDKETGSRKMYLLNQTVTQLYTKFLKMAEILPPVNRVFMDNKDTVFSSEFRSGYLSDWNLNNCYSLEGRFPLYMSDKAIGKKVVEDLNFYLGLYGRVEQKELDCFMLKRIKGNIGKKVLSQEIMNDTNAFSYDKISVLVSDLNCQRENPVFLNGFDSSEDNLTIPIIMSGEKEKMIDMEFIRNRLLSYGIELLPVKRKMDVFILENRRSSKDI